MTSPEQAHSASSTAFVPHPKTPVVLIAIAWLILVEGLVRLPSAAILFFFLLGGGNSVTVLIGFLTLVNSLGAIVVSLGIRHMRRWALFPFYVVTALGVIAKMLSLV